MEIKILCGCGTKYKFDIEPVNGRMPTPVKCPNCGNDGTWDANQQIAQLNPQPQPVYAQPAAYASPVAAPAAVAAVAPPAGGGGLRLSRAANPAAAEAPAAGGAAYGAAYGVSSGGTLLERTTFF